VPYREERIRMSKNTTGKDTETPLNEISLEQQQAMIHEEIQRFVRLAKERVSIAIEEINELLPPEITAASVLDTFMQALEVNGVAITESSENKKEDEEDQFFCPIRTKKKRGRRGRGSRRRHQIQRSRPSLFAQDGQCFAPHA